MSFINKDFMISNNKGKQLFHDYASGLPIVDYHCHLDPKEIYDNNNFANLTEAWLGGDHYKWRLMRANGVDEKYITGDGDGDDYQKYLLWIDTLNKAVGNPLYVWSHLELQRYFGISEPLTLANAETVWHKVNQQLAQDDFKKRNIVKKSQVKVLCTTDDPIDTLEYHQKLKDEEKNFSVLPTFRPDKALNINDQNYLSWLSCLEEVAKTKINNYDQYIMVLDERLQFFIENGCCISDHSIGDYKFVDDIQYDINDIWDKRRNNQQISESEADYFKTKTLIELVALYSKYEITMQLHLQATRNNNTKSFIVQGPDTGFDAISNNSYTGELKLLLDYLNSKDILPKMIIYSLNNFDYETLAALIGSYQQGKEMKLQLGAAWWFNDTKRGIRRQLEVFSEFSLLSHFVGMLTDSRSFLSYPRHEYFRRILCSLLGEWVELGEVPNDDQFLQAIIGDISYNNSSKLIRGDKIEKEKKE